MARSTSAGPLVSVVIPTYCRPTYLEQAVQSVVDQTYDAIELVVVDDNPRTPATDALANVRLDSLSAFRCIRDGNHDCANAARNTGVEAATGEFVAFLDDDDRWVEDKLARQVDAFERADEGVGMVYTGVRSIVRDGSSREDIPPSVGGDMTRALLCRNVVGSMSVVMVTAEAVEAVPLDDRFPNWGDIAWFIDLSRRYEFRRLPEPLVVYEHTSPDRLSDDLGKTVASYRLFVEKYRPLAAEYGDVFERKMRAWAAYRTGHTAFHGGDYATARRYLLMATVLYPLEGQFFSYLAAALGGKSTHRAARRVKGLLA